MIVKSKIPFRIQGMLLIVKHELIFFVGCSTSIWTCSFLTERSSLILCTQSLFNVLWCMQIHFFLFRIMVLFQSLAKLGTESEFKKDLNSLQGTCVGPRCLTDVFFCPQLKSGTKSFLVLHFFLGRHMGNSTFSPRLRQTTQQAFSFLFSFHISQHSKR